MLPYSLVSTSVCNKYPFELTSFPRNGHCGEPGNLRRRREGHNCPLSFLAAAAPEGIKVECAASLTNLDNMNSAKSGGGGGADKALSSSPSVPPSFPSVTPSLCAQLFDARQEPNKKEGARERLKFFLLTMGR